MRGCKCDNEWEGFGYCFENGAAWHQVEHAIHGLNLVGGNQPPKREDAHAITNVFHPLVTVECHAEERRMRESGHVANFRWNCFWKWSRGSWMPWKKEHFAWKCSNITSTWDSNWWVRPIMSRTLSLVNGNTPTIIISGTRWRDLETTPVHVWEDLISHCWTTKVVVPDLLNDAFMAIRSVTLMDFSQIQCHTKGCQTFWVPNYADLEICYSICSYGFEGSGKEQSAFFPFLHKKSFMHRTNYILHDIWLNAPLTTKAVSKEEQPEKVVNIVLHQEMKILTALKERKTYW